MIRPARGQVTLAAVALAGCTGGAERAPEGRSPPPALVQFVDVSGEAGIRFVHRNGATEKKFMPETVGSGCAFLDYDGDGWLDVFFVNSTDWPGPKAGRHYPALYRNLGDGSFRDVTRSAGLEMDVYGMGAAAADYDNDGDVDLFVTCIGPNRLFRNEGKGRFADVTGQAGVAGRPVQPGGLRWKWSASAAWLDYDRDGHLDLYVGNYVKWTPETDPFCGESGIKAYCPPHSFEGVPSLLYRNLGNGRFRDVSDETGIAARVGKSFGVAVADYNDDGWPDLAISNDTVENFLFLNEGGRRFVERGLEANLALSAAGRARAGMGIDVADWDHSGRPGVVIGNFSREGLALYRNDGRATFTEQSYPAGVGETSLLSLTFGLFFFDFDLDGFHDLFAANGHIDDFIQTKDAMIGYEQLPLLYRGGPAGFQSAGAAAGPALGVRRVLRGCAWGDHDNDGDPDIAVVWNNRRGELWRNDGGNARPWLGLHLRGGKSNRDGIGAVVKITAGGMTQTLYRKSGGSFLSESDPRILAGVPGGKPADVEIRWPSGGVDRHRQVEPGRYYLAVEGAQGLAPAGSGPESGGAAGQ